MKVPLTKRGMIQTALGSMFYLLHDGRSPKKGVDGNNKAPILCFHMSPRSSDEYLEVLPLLANDDGSGAGDTGRIVIAFDTPGYGSSDNPLKSCTIDEISDAFLEAADKLLLEYGDYDDCYEQEQDSNDKSSKSSAKSSSNEFVTIGSLMGNFFSVSIASRYPERVKGTILTNIWFNPKASTTKAEADDDDTVVQEGSVEIPADSRKDAAIKSDPFLLKDDGSHLMELHQKRSSVLDNELNLRVVHTEMSYLVNRRKRYPIGISIQDPSTYDFIGACHKIVDDRGSSYNINNKILCIKGEEYAEMFDKFGLDGSKRFDDTCKILRNDDDDDDEQKNNNGAVVQVEILTGDKSTLNLINQMSNEFAILCNIFLNEHRL
jgi:pimeloyl-ACP methyl ester carboxylesterase